VDVGEEVYVEMSRLEALRFCHEKVYFLRKKLESLQDKEVDIMTHIDMVLFNLEALRGQGN
jgi:prefoldin subunit 5